MIRELIEQIIRQLVDNQAQVSVQEVSPVDRRRFVRVRVASTDMAGVIGREGVTLRSLRSLVNLVNSGEPCDIVVESAE
jgi:predicted RNA-binding protein YlqC (UPF0109 family)